MSDSGKQLVISIGREFGSGGHLIAEKLSNIFNIPMFDRDLIKTICHENSYDHELLSKYDEVPRNRLLYRKVNGHSNSPSENIAKMEFDYIRNKAASGESFIVVGRCSEMVLRKHPGVITIFVLGDKLSKLHRIMETRNLSEEEAISLIAKVDKHRKNYHNFYCDFKWGDSRNYDICINSSRLGIDGTVDYLASYIRLRQAMD